MNYYKIYNQLILRAKKENRKKGEGVYYERHHIIPRCIGGTDDDDNLVLLTAREHFIVHKLLCEIHPNDNKLLYAYWMMSNKTQSENQQRLYNITNREYERIKLLISETRKSFTHSDESKKKISQSGKGKIPWNKGLKNPFSAEALDKMSKAAKGKTAWNKDISPSDETKRKMSEWQRNRINKPKSEEHKLKISKTLTGRKYGPMTEEHKQKIRQTKLNKKKHKLNLDLISKSIILLLIIIFY